jgi:hypothetical protein
MSPSANAVKIMGMIRTEFIQITWAGEPSLAAYNV